MVINLFRYQDPEPGSADGGESPGVVDGGDQNEASGDEQKEEVKDPEALLKAYNATKARTARLQEQLNTSIGQAQEWKSQLEAAPKVSQDELDRLMALDQQIKSEAQTAEEERLKSEKKWEELTALKVGEVETSYQQKISLLEEQLNAVKTQQEQDAAEKATAAQALTEYKLKTAAQSAWASSNVRGLPEAFDYMWGDVAPLLTTDDNGGIVIKQSPDSANLLTNGQGVPVSLEQYLTGLKSDKSFLFQPSNLSSGGGVAPSTTTVDSTRSIEVSSSDLSNAAKMKALSTQIGGDVMAAIRSGKVVVSYD